ncbi:MAG TPA: hypothetical protein VM939_12810, partial [Gemmatimonadaceae bacterium]|nr:hypothetical protein [Gemmatimonadaceae bacterium]
MKPSIVRLIVACVFVPISAGAQTADTLHSERPILTSGDALALAVFGAATAAALPADRWFTRQLQDPARQANRFMQRTATGARVWGNPGALIVSAGLFGAGTAGGNR